MSMGIDTSNKSGGSQAMSLTPHPVGHSYRHVLADAFSRALSAYSTSKDSKGAASTTQRKKQRARSRLTCSVAGGKFPLEALPAPPSAIPDGALPQDKASLKPWMQHIQLYDGAF